MTTNVQQLIEVAQQLQTAREEWKERLEALPMPKAKVRKFPYESLAAAIKDGFKLLDNDNRTGEDEAFRILVKGWKTIEWRKAAEKNRETRDDVAEGNVPVEKPKRVRKPKAEAAPKAEASATA
jgi:hypothetical protein